MTTAVLFVPLLADRLLDCDFKLFVKNAPRVKFLSFIERCVLQVLLQPCESWFLSFSF